MASTPTEPPRDLPPSPRVGAPLDVTAMAVLA